MNVVKTPLPEADVVRDIGYLPMQDGTRIAYISYRLKSGRHPSVFWYSHYKASAAPFEMAKQFLEAGYAFIGANFPATGCSEGIIDYWYDRKEGIYGAEVVEWIARQSWSDGNVGMIGNSTPGVIQFWVAAERPPHLRAIVASGVEDGYEDCFSVGGILQLGCVAWALTTDSEHAAGAEWRISAGDNQCAAIREGKQVVKRGFLDEVRSRPLKDEWWDSVSLACKEVAGQVNVPTMLVASWQDEFGGAARESIRLFTQLLTGVEHKKLLLMNGDHNVAGPEAELGSRSYGFVDTEQMKFLDRWVKGVEDGVDDISQVTVFWDVRVPDGDAKKAVAGWMTTHETWPEPAVERRSFSLTADAALSADEPVGGPAEGVRAYLYPTGAELVGSNQQFAVQPFPEGVLNYRSAPATSDMVLLGNPEVTLHLSVDDGDDTDLALTLKDIDAEGNVLFLQGGLLRASLRAVDEAHTYADEVVHSFRKSEKLVPGEIYEIRMSLLNPIAHVVRKGHRLELTIGAPNPILNGNSAPDEYPQNFYGNIPAGRPSINKVYHSKKYPSKLLLPILPGAVAQAPAPNPLTLRGQPSRKQSEFVPGGLPLR
ncbi:CocE/NonD family hydrolase [Mesorhizobium sp. M7A.F.Ca.CA.001.09.2.1]|nr:CocE/NonD family hydrolase [Mesorhizobium sp. M7A.F.Ca.CA.001.13.2.1]RUY60683.1 CocE/NonD family hydrolase [Mesorhizobium sp. M7A.F.Ca.CA.001.13.1.1]RUY64478.1 CocE/NonD family hydrolase [Mesorhizobium sp. M7A.F.Ca.CA.001.09.2.1]RUY65072.1 CocE/NonD family hydrolase [Mesorhizobium sp. M7A.F.Ca.CA.001.05.1.1]RUY98835.1 CocE/NonD family hydrolase [Mesorhizobium sp. M7A.F.Ca.CA.001.04.2.1]RUZ10966.1 CocE/NonD family hydrolase [Mesorhizobium sp. M7A.F.Ca.CA.001.09.1.1]RUZ21862.1 CocE/NonD fami